MLPSVTYICEVSATNSNKSSFYCLWKISDHSYSLLGQYLIGLSILNVKYCDTLRLIAEYHEKAGNFDMPY